jgi:hypothetical protein
VPLIHSQVDLEGVHNGTIEPYPVSLVRRRAREVGGRRRDG